MTAVCIAGFNLEQDLRALINALGEAGIVHRVTEEQGAQMLWLHNHEHSEQARALVQAFAQGTLTTTAQMPMTATSAPPLSPSATPANTAQNARGIKALMVRAPVTWLLIALGVVGYAVIELSLNNWLSLLTYTPIHIIGDRFSQALFEPLEIWRILTPIFIHFSFTHILFNAGAMLQIGSWLERFWGWRIYLMVCLITGIAGNVLQYVWFDSVLFGGLSGVVFGLFTFNGVTQWLNPRKAYSLPIGAYAWLAIWLIAGFTPLMETFFGLQMGNGAHLGGALAGLLLAVILNFRGNV
ncbi:MAG: rhomboid family intramembrane serine protease [Marinagarivorans sp.]|nr:rhomboid family intramembrane serine protease [Marinagarivorans sp.]